MLGDIANNHLHYKLNKVTYGRQEDLLLHLISNREMEFNETTFAYRSYSTNSYFVKTPIFLLIYFFSALFTGTNTIREHGEIGIVSNASGHIYQGFVAYLLSRLTKRKCLLRVNEDSILATELYLMKSNILNVQLLKTIFLALLKKIEVFLFTHSDWVITHGMTDYKRIRKLTRKCSFIPLTVDVSKFRPLREDVLRPLKEKLAGQSKMILYVGRLSPIKGLEYLLFAFKDVLNFFPNCVLIIIGSGFGEERYRNLVDQLDIRANVRFLGYINHDKLPEYYNIADVYVLPSLREELSNTIMEAMACGIPIVATEAGGNPYLIKDGVTGFLVPPKDINVLSRKIISILNDPRQASRISREAIEKVRKIKLADASEEYKSVLLKLVSSPQVCRSSLSSQRVER